MGVIAYLPLAPKRYLWYLEPDFYKSFKIIGVRHWHECSSIICGCHWALFHCLVRYTRMFLLARSRGVRTPYLSYLGKEGCKGGGGEFHYQIHFFNVERQYTVTITTIIPPLLSLQIIMNQLLWSMVAPQTMGRIPPPPPPIPGLMYWIKNTQHILYFQILFTTRYFEALLVLFIPPAKKTRECVINNMPRSVHASRYNASISALINKRNALMFLCLCCPHYNAR
jgi:hypothetical protein